jgi:hypothetical protein
MPFTAFVKETLAEGAHTVLLTFDMGTSGTATIGIIQARVLLLRLDDGELGENFYNEAAYSTEAGSASYVSKASLSETFQGGDYLLLGHLQQSGESISISDYGQMLLDGSDTLIEHVFEQHGTSAGWYGNSLFLAGVESLAAGSHSLAAQQKHESGTLARYSAGCVLAIRLGDTAFPELVLNSDVVDSGLAELQDATAIHVCSTDPTTYTEATSTYTLGYKTATIFPNSPAAGSPTGRKITSIPITDGEVTGNGTVKRWAVVDGSRLLARGALTPDTVVADGEAWTLDALVIHQPGTA